MEPSSFQRFRSYDHLLKVVLNACLSPFTYGFANGYFNSINIYDIANIYQVQGYSLSALQGVITGILPLTAGIGAYFTSHLLNKFSRRQTFQVLSTYTIFIHLLLMIPNIYVIFIARALQGLSIGIISAVTPLFIRQFSPTQLSGSLCPWNQIMNVVGLSFSFTLTFVLSLFLPVEIYWRISFGFPIITSLIQLYNLRYVYTYQTPKYLILQNREQQAKQLLAVIYKDEYVNEVYSQIKRTIMAMALNNRFSVISNITEEDIPHYQRMSLRQSTRKRSFLNEQQMMEIKNQTLIRMTQLNLNLQTNPLAKITAIHLSIAQQAVGMGPIIAFSGQIVGVLFPSFEKFFPILISLVAVLGTFLCIPIMKVTGRKLIIQYGSLLLGIMLIILSICLKNYNFIDFSSNSNLNKFTICVLFIMLRVTFGFSTGPVVWIYVSETVQQNFIPISTMINWMTVSVVTTFFPILNEKLGGNPTWIFMVFGIYTVLGVFVTRSLMIETQGKSQFEINKQINQKWIEFKGK